MFTRTYAVAASGIDVHHDALLSNIAVRAFDTGVDGLISDQIFPLVPVDKQSNRYPIIDQQNFLRNEDARRAPRTEARRVEFQVSSDNYIAENFALAGEIALEDLANQDTSFDIQGNTTELVTGDLKRAQEIRVANLVTSISNIGSGVILGAGSQWSDFVNSDPIGDVTTGHAFIQHTTGLMANTLVLDYDTYMIIRRHPDILDMYKYTQGGYATDANLQEVFKVGRILVGNAIVANERENLVGTAASMTQIWGRNALLCYVGAATGMQARTLGLRFGWQPANFPGPFAAHTRDESGAGTRNVRIVQAEHYQAEKIIARNLGYLINNTLSS